MADLDQIMGVKVEETVRREPMKQRFAIRTRLGVEKLEDLWADFNPKDTSARDLELVDPHLDIAEPGPAALQIENHSHIRQGPQIAEKDLFALADHVKPASAQQLAHFAVLPEPLAL